MSNCTEINISGRAIGAEHPPFVIAEMSGNHNQSLERALEIVEAAAKTGAHGLKLQTYTPDTMTLDLDERECVGLTALSLTQHIEAPNGTLLPPNCRTE